MTPPAVPSGPPELDRLATDYTTAVERGTGSWTGTAAQNYRDTTAAKTIYALEASATRARAMSVVVATTGELVEAVRSTVREVIAELVGELASSAAQRFFAYEPPLEELKQIADTTREVVRLVKALLIALDDFAMVIPAVSRCTRHCPKSSRTSM